MRLYIVDEIGSWKMSKPLSPLLALYKMNTGVCPLVFGVHGVFCADRLPVSSSVFLAYVYIG